MKSCPVKQNCVKKTILTLTRPTVSSFRTNTREVKMAVNTGGTTFAQIVDAVISVKNYKTCKCYMKHIFGLKPVFCLQIWDFFPHNRPKIISYTHTTRDE